MCNLLARGLLAAIFKAYAFLGENLCTARPSGHRDPCSVGHAVFAGILVFLLETCQTYIDFLFRRCGTLRQVRVCVAASVPATIDPSQYQSYLYPPPLPTEQPVLRRESSHRMSLYARSSLPLNLNWADEVPSLQSYRHSDHFRELTRYSRV